MGSCDQVAVGFGGVGVNEFDFLGGTVVAVGAADGVRVEGGSGDGVAATCVGAAGTVGVEVVHPTMSTASSATVIEFFMAATMRRGT